MTQYGLPLHSTCSMHDSTKLQTYMVCPRKYFYQYVVGWDIDVPNVHLEFGSAWHLTMEHLLIYGYERASIDAAYTKFCDHYNAHFSMEQDMQNGAKNKENAYLALLQYASLYKHRDTFDVLQTEIAGDVTLGDNRKVSFKIDAVCSSPERGIFCLEHKTTGGLTTLWQAEWQLKMQIHVYTHVLRLCYPPEEVYGVEINATCFRSMPRLKKDGTPYASDRGNEFLRLPIRKTTAAMQIWFEHIHELFDRLEYDFSLLAQTTHDTPVMRAFSMNTESCTKFGVCPFHQICCNTLYANPLPYCDSIPLGYAEKRWDPREKEQTAKKVIHV